MSRDVASLIQSFLNYLQIVAVCESGLNLLAVEYLFQIFSSILHSTQSVSHIDLIHLSHVCCNKNNSEIDFRIFYGFLYQSNNKFNFFDSYTLITLHKNLKLSEKEGGFYVRAVRDPFWCGKGTMQVLLFKTLIDIGSK